MSTEDNETFELLLLTEAAEVEVFFEMAKEGDAAKLKAWLVQRASERITEQRHAEQRERFLRDVILNVHHCLHTGQEERLRRFLCAAASLLDGDPVPEIELRRMTREINTLNRERAKQDKVVH